MASTAELEAEILADLEENPDAYTAPVNDVITIDPETKIINLPSSEVLFGTEEEQGVERKYFKCPRIVGDNIDLFTHQIYISYMAVRDKNATFIPDSIPKSYWCDDVALDETGNYITFSWLLSGNVLASRGFVGFAVIAKSVEGDILKTRWKTAPAVGTVLMTLPDAGEGISELYPDIITQLLDRMDAVEEIATVEAMQGYVDDYLGRNPVQLDSTLTDPEKAAPADVVGELRSDLDNVLVSNIDAKFTIDGNYVDKDNGELAPDSEYEATDLIEIPSLATGLKFDVTFKGDRSGQYNAFYDKNDNFISNLNFSPNNQSVIYEAHIPENAKYFRLSKHKTEVIINKITARYDRKIVDIVAELDNPVQELQYGISNVLVTDITVAFTNNGVYVDKETGELKTDVTYESSDFIDVPALASSLRFDVTFKSARSGEYNAFYDKNHIFISNFRYALQHTTGIYETSIPENAAYFRMSKHKTDVIIKSTTAIYETKIANIVADLKNIVVDNEEELPLYLKNEFDSTLNSVIQTIQNKNNLTVIGVMTDLHFSSSGSGFYENDLRTGVFNAAKALAEMTTKIPFDIVAFLGDYMQLPDKDNGQTKEMGISNLMDVNKMLSEMNAPTMAISGNHEGNYTGDGTGYGLTDAEIYNYLLKKSILTNKAVRHNNDYYVDDTASLTRHVFIDGRAITENESTKNWLKNVVSSNLPDGYSIIVYSHYSMDSTSVLTYVKYYIDAIIQGGHTPILWIGGHWHADRHDTYNGCLVVSLLQSGLWGSEPSEDGTTYNHTVGTVTESAFTVLIVDRDNKKVNLIRFGLGNDYEYTLS